MSLVSSSVEVHPKYVRPCFNSYLKTIESKMEATGSDSYISVVGSVGTGIRELLRYFMLCFRAAHPGATVVLAIFNQRSRLRRCHLLTPSGDEDLKLQNLTNVDSASLYICDGPPPNSFAPLGPVVVFTGANFRWLKSISSRGRAAPLFLPPFALVELLTINRLRCLDLDENQIRRRFEIFGGSAEYCLCSSLDVLEKGVRRLEEKLKSLSTWGALNACLMSERASLGVVSDVIFHIGPADTSNPTDFVIRFASSVVERAIEKISGHHFSDLSRTDVYNNIKHSAKHKHIAEMLLLEHGRNSLVRDQCVLQPNTEDIDFFLINER